VRIERWISTLPLRWRSLVRRGRVERDLDDEIHSHLELHTADNIRAGMSEADARRAAAGAAPRVQPRTVA